MPKTVAVAIERQGCRGISFFGELSKEVIMKKEFLALLLLVPLAGCVIYHPPGDTGQFGYTYDFRVPKTEMATAAVVADGTVVEPSGAQERIPEPPRVPPIYSEIAEPTPRPPAAQRRIYMLPAPVIREVPAVREAAGAAAPQPVPQAGAAAPVNPYPYTVWSGDGFFPFFPTNTTNPIIITNIIPTNQIPTNPIPTNPPPIGTNGFNIPGVTNRPMQTNAPFAPVPSTPQQRQQQSPAVPQAPFGPSAPPANVPSSVPQTPPPRPPTFPRPGTPPPGNP